MTRYVNMTFRNYGMASNQYMHILNVGNLIAPRHVIPQTLQIN